MVIATSLVMAGCSSAPDKKEAAMETTAYMDFSAAQIAHGKIAWKPAALESVADAAAVPGQVTPDEDHTVRLGAPARGRVTAVLVSPGDRVATGQTLVTLESTDAGTAQSDVAKANAALSSRRAQAQYARAAKERSERLLALKSIPRQEFERAVADDELAQSDLRGAEAEVRRAESSARQLGADAGANGRIVLRAPRAGVVLSRSAVPGAVVDAGMAMVVITDPSRLWLVVNAPEQFSGLFRAGGRLRFVVPAYADTFTATITAVGAGLDADTRTLQVRGTADGASGRLKPGMLATVYVSGARQLSAVMLPEDAVQMMQGKATVFIVAPDARGGARITPRDVAMGPRANGRIAIVRGLKAGDVVVTSGAFSVRAAFGKGAMPKMEM